MSTLMAKKSGNEEVAPKPVTLKIPPDVVEIIDAFRKDFDARHLGAKTSQTRAACMLIQLGAAGGAP